MAKYDLAIIGSGPGGYNTAIRAAQWGLKTLVIEKDGFLGGTCLHVGCIPTKVLLHTAEIYDTFKNAKEFGIDVKEFTLNWAAALARKEKVVNRHAKGIEFLFRKNKVETMQGWGRWAGPGRVSVENAGKTTEVEATHIMFATGSAARSLPGVEIDGKIVLSNIEILQLPAVPKNAGDCRRRGGGRGVCLDLQFVRHAGHRARNAAARHARRGRRDFRRTRKGAAEKRHPDFHRGQGGIGEEGREGRDRLVQGQGRKDANAGGRARADGRGPHAENGKSGPRKIAGQTRARLRSRRARTWKRPSRASTPSATSSRACRNWRTPPRWKASPAWRKLPASNMPPIEKTRIPNAPTASRRSRPLA